MTDVQGCDYILSVEHAQFMKGVVGLPAEYRRQALELFRREHGQPALIDLFAAFIGLANSVVANNRTQAEDVLIVEGVGHPDRPADLNLPTVFGALCGVENAALCAVETCHGCAFRLGTVANQCPSTAIDAGGAIDGEFKFFCHEDMTDAGDPAHLCRGYAAVTKLRQVVTGEIGADE